MDAVTKNYDYYLVRRKKKLAESYKGLRKTGREMTNFISIVIFSNFQID